MNEIQNSRVRIAISMGDPAGIGPEIIVKALAEKKCGDASFLIIGSEHYLKEALRSTGVDLEYSVVDKAEYSSGINLFQPVLWEGVGYDPFGAWSAETGRQSLEYVKTGVRFCLNNQADAIVTAPICKAAWKKAGCEFPGHTELLGQMCNLRDEVMMLAGGGLRVGLVTIHEAIVDLPRLVTVDKICKTIRIIDHDLKTRFAIESPKFAVLGLNPHAGEDGHIGREEIDVINPAVSIVRQEGIVASDAIPADTAFYRMLKGEFDVVLAMYHDQGLAALKTIAFDSGINVTLGLPIIRTSVDHGTAFEIAGSGKAVAESMKAAIGAALEMVGNEKLL